MRTSQRPTMFSSQWAQTARRVPTIAIPSALILVFVPALFAEFSFESLPIIDTPGGTVDLALADMDGDQDLDIVALEGIFSNGEGIAIINILLNDGGGSFDSLLSFEVGVYPGLELFVNNLVKGDLDADGSVDLAFYGSTAPLTAVFNDGKGNLGRAVAIAPATFDLTPSLGLGDLDGDGLLDLAIGKPGRIAFNGGDGDFTVVNFSGDVNPAQLEIVELDGVGTPDIAYGFRTLIADQDGVFTPIGAIPASGSPDCAFADFDGDGDSDVACVRPFFNRVDTALNLGDATFGPAVQLPTAQSPQRIRATDLNGDGVRDLVVTHGPSCGQECDNTPFLSVLTGIGEGHFSDPLIIEAASGEAIAAGDLNGDGRDDLVLGTTNPMFGVGGIQVLINTAAQSTPGDLDGDGQVRVPDLVILLGAWGLNPSHPADLDGDGEVRVPDLIILLGNWG